MTEAGAQKAVLASFLAVGGGMVWETSKKGARPPLRQFVALVIVAAALAALAGAAPDLAGWFSILVAVSYFIART